MVSTGPWKPRDAPPDYRPRAPIAELFEELAALDSKRAEVNGLLSQHFRRAEADTKKAAPPVQEHGTAFKLTG